MNNPIQPFLDFQDALILDGGLATELEARGCDLRDELWSARLLLENPTLIQEVHLDYYRAGADCGISASYQATIPALMARGLSEAEAIALIRLSVRLVMQARDQFWAEPSNRQNRLRPIVAASVGPYGAALADGSEYTGDYDLDEAGLVEWHRQRWHILANSGADILACETLPSHNEMRALAQLMGETPEMPAWVSFSCRDERNINDGTPIADCAAFLDGVTQVVAVGINCTPPSLIPSLIREVRSVTQKPIVVYPNSGETYDAVQKVWLGQSVPSEFGTFSREWRKEGAALIGGCCRTRPAHIRQIADRMRRRGGQV
ncbi:MAG: homocysteine S-methyltransferase [Ardenticatenaceae bacterium]|nr:homocysteine S-methyltransferase [Ardenticatenaceae bacterium]MCB9446652.1 homocysteine S-methyltransferase [Ardenticatenaceae bacterium]